MRYLNLGCGSRFHPDWANLDATSSSPHVQAHDLRRGIPCPDNTFDVVYHSHLLEHFPKHQAPRFVQECYRVLVPGGTMRVVVPDLERMARTYLLALEKALQGLDEWRHHYDWMMMELCDQTVRERPGGEMATYLRQETIPNREFVLERMGVEAQHIFRDVEHGQNTLSTQTRPRSGLLRTLRRIHHFLRDPSFRRERMVQHLLGAEYELLQLGRFRRGGEVHLWMYDRYSLARLLLEAGFQDAQAFGPAESQIPDWTDFHLDTEPDGTVYKPDSLYMEATKH